MAEEKSEVVVLPLTTLGGTTLGGMAPTAGQYILAELMSVMTLHKWNCTVDRVHEKACILRAWDGMEVVFSVALELANSDKVCVWIFQPGDPVDLSLRTRNYFERSGRYSAVLSISKPEDMYDLWAEVAGRAMEIAEDRKP